jgi:hypothetical protein
MRSLRVNKARGFFAAIAKNPLLVILMASALLVGLSTLRCSAQPTRPPDFPKAEVQFIDRSDVDFVSAIETDASRDGVSLSISSIAALNKDIAFLYGQSSAGSIVLRTADGGKRWQEVMVPDIRSRVNYIRILPEKEALALHDKGSPLELDESSKGLDGSFWTIQRISSSDGQADEILVLRKLVNQPMALVSRISIDWRYKQGQILPR